MSLVTTNLNSIRDYIFNETKTTISSSPDTINNTKPPPNETLPAETPKILEKDVRSEFENFVIPTNANVTIEKQIFQTFNNCGPATLSMILSFHGINMGQQNIADVVRPYQVPNGDNDDKNVSLHEFKKFIESNSLYAYYRVGGKVDTLKFLLANGYPVIARTWLNNKEDIGHFIIVTGYNNNNQTLNIQDSYYGKRNMSYTDFLDLWRPFNYEFIIVSDSLNKNRSFNLIDYAIPESSMYQKAIDLAKNEINGNNNRIYGLFNISTSYYHLKDYTKSIEYFEMVEPDLPDRMLWYQLEPVLAYKELKNYDKVFRILNNMLEKGNRAYAEAYFIKGQIFENQGKIEEAKKEYQKAIIYNKNYTEAKEALDLL